MIKNIIYWYGVYNLCLTIDDITQMIVRIPKVKKMTNKIKYGDSHKKEKATKNQIGFIIGD
jgi:hypothetical protein